MVLTFDDMIRTTRTVIVDTNMNVDIKALFEVIPITEYSVPAKKKGRKRKDVAVIPESVKSGSVLSAKYEGNTRGVSFTKSKCAFKNSITLVLDIFGKKINMKLSKNGRFQITGNNNDDHIEECVRTIWSFIKTQSIYTLRNGNEFKATYWSSMTNFKTNIGFRIDRQLLNTYINENTEYVSVFETSSGSASVNIKIPLKFDDLELRTIHEKNDIWERGVVSYNDVITGEVGKLKNKDNRLVSFLVFHTGEVIMTSIDKGVMKPYFEKFMSIIEECKDKIII